MNTLRYDQMLAQQLNDPNGLIFSAAMRGVALSEACRNYSRYRKFTRRFGTGHVYQAAAPAAMTIYAVGGPYAVGAVLTLDPGTPWQEFAQVTAIAANDLATDTLVSTPVKLSLLGGLAFAHGAGSFITQASLGLAIVSATDTYAMPFDFIQPDLESWDLATGARRMVKYTNSFYDEVYRESERLSGVGFGQSTGFAGAGNLGGSFVGIPANAQGLISPPGGGGETQYIFNPGSPPTLQIIPTPTVTTTYDFRYVAQHLPQNVPDADLDALLDAGVMAAYESRAASLIARNPDWREADVSESVSGPIKQAIDLAAAAQKRFETKVRRPYAVSG